MERKPCPVENSVEVDVVQDGRYEGRVIWLKLVGEASRTGRLFPLTVPAALVLSYALNAKLNPRPLPGSR
jgi:hypothetical protein